MSVSSSHLRACGKQCPWESRNSLYKVWDDYWGRGWRVRGKQRKVLNQAVVKGLEDPQRNISGTKRDLPAPQKGLQVRPPVCPTYFGDADLCSIRCLHVSGRFEQIPGTQTTYEQTQRSVLWWDLDRPQRVSVSPLLTCHPETHLGSTGVMGLKHLTRCAFNSDVPENAKHCY